MEGKIVEDKIIYIGGIKYIKCGECKILRNPSLAGEKCPVCKKQDLLAQAGLIKKSIKKMKIAP